MSKLPNTAEYDNEFTFITADAHRRPATPITPPAITWHLAFRRPRDNLDEQQWYEAVERLVLFVLKASVDHATSGRAVVWNMRDAKKTVTATTRAEEVGLLRNHWMYGGAPAGWSRVEGKYDWRQRYEAVVIESEWRQLPYWMRFEMFEEHFALFTCIRLDSGDSHSVEPAINRGPKRSLRAVVDGVNARFREFSKNRKASSAPSAERRGVTSLYERAWVSFRKDILDDAFETYIDDDQPLRAVHHDVFTDFRGLILHATYDPASNPGVGGIEGFPPLDDAERLAREDLARGRRTRVAYGQRDGQPGASPGTTAPESRDTNKVSPQLEYAWAKSLEPILAAVDGPDTPASSPLSTAESVDYTFSSFGSHRFIYGSSLGARFEDLNRELQGKPLTYIALCFHNDERQIGRTIARLQMLGALRLAGLFDL